jgi:hypothetical protein
VEFYVIREKHYGKDLKADDGFLPFEFPDYESFISSGVQMTIEIEIYAINFEVSAISLRFCILRGGEWWWWWWWWAIMRSTSRPPYHSIDL